MKIYVHRLQKFKSSIEAVSVRSASAKILNPFNIAKWEVKYIIKFEIANYERANYKNYNY